VFSVFLLLLLSIPSLAVRRLSVRGLSVGHLCVLLAARRLGVGDCSGRGNGSLHDNRRGIGEQELSSAVELDCEDDGESAVDEIEDKVGPIVGVLRGRSDGAESGDRHEHGVRHSHAVVLFIGAHKTHENEEDGHGGHGVNDDLARGLGEGGQVRRRDRQLRTYFEGFGQVVAVSVVGSVESVRVRFDVLVDEVGGESGHHYGYENGDAAETEEQPFLPEEGRRVARIASASVGIHFVAISAKRSAFYAKNLSKTYRNLYNNDFWFPFID